MSRILIPLPRRDYDPTEAGVPWLALSQSGHRVVFATPDGLAATADQRIVRGRDLGPHLCHYRTGRSHCRAGKRR